MAHTQVAEEGMASNMEGGCEYIEQPTRGGPSAWDWMRCK